MSYTFHMEIEREDGVVEVEVTYTATPFIPAQTYGLPENCSPAEGGECEIESVEFDGKEFVLTDKGEALVQAACEKRVADDQADAADDYDEGRDWEE